MENHKKKKKKKKKESKIMIVRISLVIKVLKN
jgi:hypothetical protein